MSKIIMHIDLNAFFARAEEIRNPAYKGKPIIVGGLGPRGVVSTASYEARRYGVHSAMPIGQARELCPHGVFLECDFGYYEMLSRSFFGFLKSFSPLIEQASIDEGWVDMTHYLRAQKDPLEALQALQTSLYRKIGLMSSIGVAPNKFLAKMASDMKKPMGITIIRRRDIRQKLYVLPISAFYGIGSKSLPFMKETGIETIGDLAKLIEQGDQRLKHFFGKAYQTIKEEIEGHSSDIVDPTPFDPKSIGHSETFDYDTNIKSQIEAKIIELAQAVALGAKREGKKGKTVTLNVKDASFRAYSRSTSLSESTNDEEEIVKHAIRLYESNFLGSPLRLVGVTLSRLVDPKSENVQMTFWNFEEYEAADKTKLLVAELNRKLEKPSLMIASEVKKNGY